MMDPTAQEQALELYDIYGLWHVPFWQRTWFIVCMVLLVSALLFGVCYLLIKQYKAKKPPIPAWKQALQRLQELKRTEMLKKEKSERYYVQLTKLIKEYMSDQFGTNIRSLTDQQMCAYIDERTLYNKQKEQLKQIFSAGELIKFANQDAIEQQMLDDWHHAHAFIMHSKEHV